MSADATGATPQTVLHQSIKRTSGPGGNLMLEPFFVTSPENAVELGYSGCPQVEFRCSSGLQGRAYNLR